MSARFTKLWTVVAGVAVGAACNDSSTAPRHAEATPSFAAMSDTGGGGGKLLFHFVSNGEFEYVNWFTFTDSGGGAFSYTAGILDVGRGGATNNPQTFLNYEVYQFGCDAFFNCVYNLLAAGNGLIPNRDLSGGGRQFKLTTNTANDPNFIVYAGSPGPVSVTWNANGLSEYATSGTSSSRFGNFTNRQQGSFNTASANATGSVVGVPIGSVPYAQIGTNHYVTIDIYR